MSTTNKKYLSEINRLKKLYTKTERRKIAKDLIPIEGEIWKEIKDFPSYFVSSLGRIKHVYSNREIVIKSWKSKSTGYMQTMLIQNKIKKNKRVHRLVAEMFIKNTDNKPHVNHIDGDKTNNRIENLEWVTPSENQIHAIENGLQPKITSEKNKLRKVPINVVHEVCKMISEGKTNSEIKKAINIEKYLSSNAFLSRLRKKQSFCDISKDYF